MHMRPTVAATARGLLSLACAALLSLASAPALAAKVTDVADAADGEDPFDAHIEVKLEVSRQGALITRENTQIAEDDVNGQPRTVDVRELDYQRFKVRLMPRIEVGIFHDLAAFLEWPIVLWDQQSTKFTSGTNASNSTIARDHKDSGPAPTIDGWPQTCGSGMDSVDGNNCYGFPAGPYNDWRISREDGTYQSVRAGFDYPALGVRWSPTNNERDPTKPTITLQADYNLGFLPLPVADPTEDPATPDDPGAVALGAHKFHFQVAMAKRWLLLEPYFVVDYWLPFATSDSYPGLQPRHRGGVLLGMEIIPYENKKLDQKFAIDISTTTQYFSEGRDYSELSDALRELTYTGQFMRSGANLGLYFRAFEYIYFDVTGSILYDTEHFLTSESIGKDKDQSGDDGYGVVDLDPSKQERNVYYNPVLDTPGRRLKVEENLHLQVMVHAALTF